MTFCQERRLFLLSFWDTLSPGLSYFATHEWRMDGHCLYSISLWALCGGVFSMGGTGSGNTGPFGHGSKVLGFFLQPHASSGNFRLQALFPVRCKHPASSSASDLRGRSKHGAEWNWVTLTPWDRFYDVQISNKPHIQWIQIMSEYSMVRMKNRRHRDDDDDDDDDEEKCNHDTCPPQQRRGSPCRRSKQSTCGNATGCPLFQWWFWYCRFQ